MCNSETFDVGAMFDDFVAFDVKASAVKIDTLLIENTGKDDVVSKSSRK